MAQAAGMRIYTYRCAIPGIPPLRKLSLAQDAVVLSDERTLPLRNNKLHPAAERTLSLARHRNVSLIITAQNTAQIPRDALRHELTFVFKELDGTAALFEREEILALFETARRIHASLNMPEPTRRQCALFHSDGQWLLSANPLPANWSSETSTYGRRRAPR